MARYTPAKIRPLIPIFISHFIFVVNGSTLKFHDATMEFHNATLEFDNTTLNFRNRVLVFARTSHVTRFMLFDGVPFTGILDLTS